VSTYHFVAKSRNEKTGPIPVTTTSNNTCPDTCPFKGASCYAEAGFHLRQHWQAVSTGKRGGSLGELCASIAALPDGQLWRHNQAGDLPGSNDVIDGIDLGAIVDANTGRRGFTYTHKPMVASNRAAVATANARGFTINLSANDLAHADELAALAIAPVVVVLPADVHGNQDISTPEGRKVAVCPATYRDDVTCASCGLCQKASRKVIVGFPAHGTKAREASAIAQD